MRGPALQRLDRGVGDVGGGVEVGLADLEVDDAAPLGLEGPGANQDFEGGLRAEPRQAFRELHGVPPRPNLLLLRGSGLVRRDQGAAESSLSTP